MINEIKITSLAGRGSMNMMRGDRRGYWLEDVDWGQVEGQHNTYGFYNQVGESIVSTTVNSRAITITGLVFENQGTMRARLDALNAFISPVEDYTLIYNDRKIQFRPDRSVIYSREYLTNNGKLRKFMIQGTVAYPLFSGAEDAIVEFLEATPMFTFPSGLGMSEPVVFGLSSAVQSATINNTGGFEAGVTIRLDFSGEVQNPRVYNRTTGKFVGVDRTFSAGESLEICTVPGEKHITLTNVYGEEENMIRYRNYQMSWWTLQPGANVVALECLDASQIKYMDIEIRYSPLYMEVE